MPIAYFSLCVVAMCEYRLCWMNNLWFPPWLKGWWVIFVWCFFWILQLPLLQWRPPKVIDSLHPQFHTLLSNATTRELNAADEKLVVSNNKQSSKLDHSVDHTTLQVKELSGLSSFMAGGVILSRVLQFPENFCGLSSIEVRWPLFACPCAIQPLVQPLPPGWKAKCGPPSPKQ